MLDRLRLAVPIVLIIPLMTLCCTSDSAENLTGPMGPTDGESDPSYDVTGDWAFSTYRGSDIVCTWHLELEMAANGKISGSGKKGFVTLFVPGTHYIDDEPPPVAGQLRRRDRFRLATFRLVLLQRARLQVGEIKANAARFTVTGVPTNACVSFQIRAFRNAGKHGILRSAWTPWLHVRMP